MKTAPSRQATDGLVRLFALGAGSGALLILALILLTLFRQGSSALSFDFIFSESRNFGREGGVFYQILGTLLLTLSAGLFALPFALGAAVYMTRYLGPGGRRAAETQLFALNGTPTIVFGLFGYMIFGKHLGLGVSWVSGALILALMILPTVTLTIKEAMDSIPGDYIRSARALALCESALIFALIIPGARRGIITGLLLGFARAAGETAAIMFTATAFYGVTLPHSASEPVSTLQTHILTLTQEALNPETRANAWGAALLLIGVVFLFNFASFFIRFQLRKSTRGSGF